jgi:hypothetical protein
MGQCYAKWIARKFVNLYEQWTRCILYDLEHRDIVLNEKRDLIVRYIAEKVQRLAQRTLHQADTIGCKYTVTDLQRTFPVSRTVRPNVSDGEWTAFARVDAGATPQSHSKRAASVTNQNDFDAFAQHGE